MDKRKILLISQVFYPDEVAVANLFTNLCTELVKSGLEVRVWCAQPSYTCRERQQKHKIYQGIYIHYLPSTNFRKDKIFGRLINYFTYSVSTVLKLIFSRDKTKVITHTTPPFLAIIISFLCKLKNREFFYVLLDVFPDGLIRLNKVSSRNILIKIWRSLHLKAFKRCKRIVVIGRDMKKWLCDFYPGGYKKVEYIPLWQDKELITPVDFNDNPFVSDLHLQDHFVVQYSGNMGLWNDMEALGRAISKSPDGIMFVFIGNGMRKKELIESIKNDNLSNVLFIPFQSNRNYSLSVCACHVALVNLREGLEGIAVPSKIIGIMGAGIPVIAMVPKDSEIAYIVEEEKCGYVLKPSDSDGLINTIIRLKSDEVLRKSMGQNGRRAFEKKYTSKIIAEKYSAIFVS